MTATTAIRGWRWWLAMVAGLHFHATSAAELPPLPPAPPPRANRPVPILQRAEQGRVTNSTSSAVPAIPAASNQVVVHPIRAPAARQPLAAPRAETNLVWDALVKEQTVPPGSNSVEFAFSCTNVTDKEVTITGVHTSCGCTVAKLPMIPWKLAPGTNGTFGVTVDVRGKSGVLNKTVTVETTEGQRFLTVRAMLPASGASGSMGDRTRNMQVALADRQAVFKGDCAACHLQPGIGKKGQELYLAVCGVCHEAVHRATMVPNLRTLKPPAEPDYWVKMISQGKTNSLMPAFAIKAGGPLTEAQIGSLAEYLAGPFQQQSGKPAASAAEGTTLGR